MSISQFNKILASDASSLINGLSISGKTITYTKVDGTTGTLTTQDTNTTYSAGTGLSLSSNQFSLATVVTAGDAGPTANASPAHGGSFTVPYFTYDAYGRVTGRTNRTITLPAAGASAATAHIIETWHNDTLWYRKWSDGWIEQGGTATTTDILTTFATPFLSKVHGLCFIPHYNSGNATGFSRVGGYDITLTNFNVHKAGYTGGTWTACGY